ncbi:phytoene/squalene synthase family protein [Algihabitans albus]|uniref:phytoene/squalene synthase family protein n=1 Tax=Algihabitans albus TaxID=2164067 RepID=UPI000E5D8422|nr:phytoene/squalene synthase family protein [Algihabitans albus]
MPSNALSYCAQEVRTRDRDRFLACLFAPAERREALFALYAFNLEVAKTAELVSEPTLGQIRLQWWREALDQIYLGGPVREHQVVEPLAAAIRDRGLERAAFERLLEAREADLDPAAPSDLAALERYAEGTSATLQRLALTVLGCEGEAAQAAARHVGVAWALTGLLRAVPFHARQKRLYLPEDHLAVTGVKIAELFELQSSDALTGVVMRLAKRAREHLAEARHRHREVSREALPALLPARLADGYLTRLERSGFDPFDSRVQMALPNRALRLWWAAARNRY